MSIVSNGRPSNDGALGKPCYSLYGTCGVLFRKVMAYHGFRLTRDVVFRRCL